MHVGMEITGMQKETKAGNEMGRWSRKAYGPKWSKRPKIISLEERSRGLCSVWMFHCWLDTNCTISDGTVLLQSFFYLIQCICFHFYSLFDFFIPYPSCFVTIHYYFQYFISVTYNILFNLFIYLFCIVSVKLPLFLR